MKVSRWKVDHPTDTKDDEVVGLCSEDKAEGLPATPGVARHRSGGPAPVPVPPEPHHAEDEVVVTKRALKWVKQQMLALLRREDLPEGAQVREVTNPSCCQRKERLSGVPEVFQDPPPHDGSHGSTPW